MTDVPMRLDVDVFFDSNSERDERIPPVKILRVFPNSDDLATEPRMISGTQIVGTLEFHRGAHGEPPPVLHHPHFRFVEGTPDERIGSKYTFVHIEPPSLLGLRMCDRVGITRLLRYRDYNI